MQRKNTLEIKIGVLKEERRQGVRKAGVKATKGAKVRRGGERP